MLSAALAYPMLAKKKLVVVREFDKMKMPDPESLMKYIQHPQKSTAIVLSAEDTGRGKWWNTLLEASRVIECKPIPENRLSDWIARRVKERGFSIDQDAVTFLINQVGSSLLYIDQELDKVANFKDAQTAITVSDLEQTSGSSREENIFALQKALSHRQIPKSLRICGKLLDEGHDLNEINAILFAYFRKMLVAASLRKRGQGLKEVAESMSLPAYQLQDMFEAMHHFNYQQIRNIIRLLHEIDVKSKTSAVNSLSGLQMLCYNICRI